MLDRLPLKLQVDEGSDRQMLLEISKIFSHPCSVKLSASGPSYRDWEFLRPALPVRVV